MVGREIKGRLGEGVGGAVHQWRSARLSRVVLVVVVGLVLLVVVGLVLR